MNQWVVAFIAFDLVVTILVIMWVVKRRVGDTMGVLGVDFAGLRRFSESAQVMATEYMRANYSGDPESLPGVLNGLLDRLEAQAKAQGLPLDRQMLRSVMRQLASREGLASAAEVGRALKKVA